MQDVVERDLDGMWFEAEVLEVHLPPPRGQEDRHSKKSTRENRKRRIAYYDLFYPDTKNNELDVPEDEIRLKVTGLVKGKASDKVTAGSNRLQTCGEDNVIGVRGVVLVGKNINADHESKFQSKEESKSSSGPADSQRLGDDISAAERAHNGSDIPDVFGITPAPRPEEGGHVTLHNVDDNERFQSTGTAYLTHGHVGQDRKAVGGGGLRAIRLLRK